MSSENKSERYSVFLNILAWGAIWGIFEATVGYLLHLFSFGYSFIVWYPAACFFMTNVYRKTRRVSSIFFVGLLCASVKMLNLFLPGRIDKVLNPAVSIVFEALAMAVIVIAAERLLGEKRKNPFVKALAALAMNTGWRLLYVLYLLFLVPGWIRDVSVISSAGKFIPFFATQNLITSVLIYIGYQFKDYILKPVGIAERGISNLRNALPRRAAPILKTGVIALMLCFNIVLELLL